MKKLSNLLYEKLRPQYIELLNSVATYKYDKAIFCMQWGINFPDQNHCGILFVGRATNGWKSNSVDIDVLFGSNEESKIFNCSNQMQWVEDHTGSTAYNTNKSAFWRTIRSVSKKFYPQKWSSYIAWSNVCKVAPYEKGSPNDSLYYAQLEDSRRILKTEIEILSPKIVIFLTGESWYKDFIEYLVTNQLPSIPFDEKKWDNYKSIVYEYQDIVYICSEHPQGKDEGSHASCLINIISKYT